MDFGGFFLVIRWPQLHFGMTIRLNHGQKNTWFPDDNEIPKISSSSKMVHQSSHWVPHQFANTFWASLGDEIQPSLAGNKSISALEIPNGFFNQRLPRGRMWFFAVFARIAFSAVFAKLKIFTSVFPVDMWYDYSCLKCHHPKKTQLSASPEISNTKICSEKISQKRTHSGTLHQKRTSH